MDKHKYKIIDIYNFTDHTYKLSCERNNFEFISGQCVNIGLVGSGINREYSTYSSENDEILEFCDPRIQLIKNSVEEMFDVEIKDHSLYFFGTKKKK